MEIAYVEHVRQEADALLRAARTTPLDTPVPACPGWDVAALLDHVGHVHRWAARNVASGERVPLSTVEGPGDDGVIAYVEAGAAELVDTLSRTDPALPGWNFTPAEQVRGFWWRRQATETLLHRLDLEEAAGSVTAVDPVLAADGIDEALFVMAPRMLGARDGIDIGGSLHVHCTDADGEWTIHTDDGVLRVERGHQKGDAAVRGPAAGLLLLLWGRASLDDGGVECFGDAEVARRWLALPPTP